MTVQTRARASALILLSTAAVPALLAGYAVAAGTQRFEASGAAFPGTATSITQFVGFFLAAVASTVVLGALAHVVTTATPDDDGRLDAATFRVHLLVERLAPLATVLSAVMAVVTAAAAAGSPVTRLVTSAALWDAVTASEQARGWCAATLFALIVAVGVRFTVRWLGHMVLLLPASLSVMAFAVTGNPGQGPDHDVATSAVIVFALALAVLVGGQVAAVVSPPPEALRLRVRVIGVASGAVALLFGVVLAVVLAPWAMTSRYGLALLAAGVLLIGLVVTLRRFAPNGGTAVAAIAVVGAATAAAVDVPPRFLAHPFTVWDVFLGYELPGSPTVANLITVWRFDPLLGTAAIVLGVAYLYAVRRLHRRHDAWPVGRTVAWVTGCVALLISTSSGVRAYGSAMFSVHMGEHMALNMFVPVLLVLGAPVTLALRVLPPAGSDGQPGPREWVLWFVHSPVTRFLSHPMTAFALFVGSLYVVYFTPLFDTLIRYHWGHEFMSVHFLLTGYLFYWGIIGVDPGPKRLPFLGRLGLLFAVMPFHAFFGIATMTMSSNLGDYFYRSLSLPWIANLSDDQHLGGAIAWGSSELPVLIVVIALVAQWARQDRRDGARKDRHSDTGYDDDLDAYNAMLAELHRQRR
jgi:cytochrome c oxidase assembly factor CtaG